MQALLGCEKINARKFNALKLNEQRPVFNFPFTLSQIATELLTDYFQ